MYSKNLIAVNDFCSSHNIEISFISSLNQNGLIHLETIRDSEFILAEQLQQIEKFICFYYDLDINMEGIETIDNLLKRINMMQDEITALRNRLRLYEQHGE